MADSRASPQRLVLIGGGHAHLLVLEALVRGEFPPTDVTLVAPYARHLYSGMVGGLISGRYRQDELTIDLQALAVWAGGRFIAGWATRVDATGRQIELEAGEQIPYDLASFATGSGVTGLSPGDLPHAIAVKPIDDAGSVIPMLEVAATGGQPLRASASVAGTHQYWRPSGDPLLWIGGSDSRLGHAVEGVD